MRYLNKIGIQLILSLILCFIYKNGHSQLSSNVDLFGTYSKEISVQKGKKYLLEQVLKPDERTKKLEVYGLSAASSGDLTTLIYNATEDDDNQGLLLVFYGNYWNEAGVQFQGYDFLNFDTEKAIDFLSTIRANTELNKDYLRKGSDSNIYFKYDDLTILATGNSVTFFDLRILWKDFDLKWEAGSFNRTVKRFEKRLVKFNKK